VFEEVTAAFRFLSKCDAPAFAGAFILGKTIRDDGDGWAAHLDVVLQALAACQ
jgi:hypothetical protein